MLEKNTRWSEANEIHKVEVAGPFVAPEGFALRFGFDSTNRQTGERRQFSEVAVYPAVDGRIVREEFLMGAG